VFTFMTVRVLGIVHDTIEGRWSSGTVGAHLAGHPQKPVPRRCWLAAWERKPETPRGRRAYRRRDSLKVLRIASEIGCPGNRPQDRPQAAAPENSSRARNTRRRAKMQHRPGPVRDEASAQDFFYRRRKSSFNLGACLKPPWSNEARRLSDGGRVP